MKKGVLLLHFAFSVWLACGQSDPRALFESAQEAVDEHNWKLLSEYITTDEEISTEMAQAVARLILLVKSGDYAEFYEDHKQRIEAAQPQVLQHYFLNLAYFIRLPDFEVVADSGVYRQEERAFVLNTGGADIVFSLAREDGEYTFWPPYVRPTEKLITLVELYDEYRSAILKTTEEDTKRALEELVEKHIPGTSLAYEDHPVSGAIEGVEWSMVSGKAEQRVILGKKRIQVTLSGGELPADCREIFPGCQATFFVQQPGEYDFALTGQNVTLYDPNRNVDVVLTDGKLSLEVEQETVRGRIAARGDAGNYLNGTFEVSVCGELEDY